MMAFLFLAALLCFQAAKSETVIGCNERTCLTENSSRNFSRDFEDTSILAQCHAACLEKIVPDNQKRMAREANPAWPTISLSDLALNCVELRKITECRAGCVLKSRRTSQCSKTCKARCSECSDEICFYGHTRCSDGQCPSEPDDGCRIGCRDVKISDLVSTTIPNPTVPLVATEKERVVNRPAGQYDVGNYPAPSVSSAQRLGAIVYRMQTDNATFYQFTTSLSGETLDLGPLACQQVNVSFAVVTDTQISSFSQPASICVYGGFRYPPQLRISDVSIDIAQDDRPGFTSNAAVIFSWPEPKEPDLIFSYTLTLFTDDSRCTSGDFHLETHNFTSISNSATDFKIQARAPNEAPRKDCPYHYEITVLPAPHNVTGSQGFFRVVVQSRIPHINLTCGGLLNSTTGLLFVEARWTIPSPDAHRTSLEATKRYNVSLEWLEDTSTEKIAELIVEPGLMHSRQIATIEEIIPRDGIVQIDVRAQNKVDFSEFLVPRPASCHLQVSPEPPSTIDTMSIIIHNFEHKLSELELNMTWDPPQFPYGMIVDYQVRLLRVPARSLDEVSDKDQIAVTTEDQEVMPGEIITKGNPYVEEDALCLFVQIRSQNEFMVWSDWSNTVPIVLFPDTHPECQSRASGLVPRLPATTWVGIVMGSVVFLILCVLCFCLWVCICRRHRMKRQMKRAFENGYQNPVFAVGGVALRRRNSSMRAPLTLTHGSIELDDWELPVGSVIVDTKFGEGCFGEVHRGVVRGPLPSTRTMKSNICVTVAIKMLKTSATGSERTDFLHEIDTMKKIAEGNNPHVINFIGCVTVQEPLCLITEFVKYGDLLSYLETIRKLIMHKNRQRKLARIAGISLKEPEPYLVPQNKKLPPPESAAAAAAAALLQSESMMGGAMGVEWEGMSVMPSPDSPYAELGGVDPVNLINFAYQIASGMEYLSSLDIVHRDLACRNILIGENKSLKISDFGMSRVVTGEDIYVKTTKGRLPWKWMAIESIVNREFTHASDVWAYGVTLWEIATLGGFPYPMISNAELLDHLKRGFRLECPDNCCPEIYKVMLECWSEDPDDRKTFPELRSLFETLLAENNQYIQFDNINIHKPYYNTVSQRNSRIQEAEERESSVVGLSESEVSTTTSTVTLNGAAASGAYDYLRPLAPSAEVADVVDEQQLALHMANHYVETPTFKFLMSQEGVSSFELELERIQQGDEMESSAEVQVEIDTSANSAIAVE